MRNTYLFLLLFIFSYSHAQDYSVKNIDATLLKNANAVVRNESTKIILKDFDVQEEHYSVVITALNRSGIDALDPIVGYSGNDKVKNISAVLYDKNGKEIESFKEKDFADVSASGGDLYSDNRLKSLGYVEPPYPFTLKFEYELKSNTTGFIKPWIPRTYSTVAVENSKYEVVNEKEVPLIKKEYNLEGYNVDTKEASNYLSYSINTMNAVENEYASPHYTEFVPMVKVALKKFRLENSVAEISTWKDFGLWQNEKLLKGRDELSQETKNIISNLVKDLKTDEEKVKAIYEYMQNKTRYISVQVGIGGWQPSPAEDVDKLGYGDCKGLTNYTKALLESQGITSYYSIVDSQENGVDIDEDFVALQGNHVILAVPLENENIFLECTSQDIPFGFLGSHTDDRKVVMMTPDGGVITKTPTYSEKDNTRDFSATVVLDENLMIRGTTTEVSKGLIYNSNYHLKDYDKEELDRAYKNAWSHLNSLRLSDISFNNDKDKVVFTENLTFEAKNYVSKAGNRLLLNPNIFHRFEYTPQSVSTRKLPISIRRGKTYNDEITLILPDDYEIEAMFEPIEISNEFGSYEASLENVGGGKLVYKRKVVIKAVKAPKESFEKYDSYIKSLVKSDNSKIVLVKK